MNFNDYLNIENNFQKQAASVKRDDFDKQTLAGFMEFRTRMEQSIKERSFEYFYEDVSAVELEIDFTQILGEKSFKNASEDARECLMICPQFSRISQYQILSWLSTALKFSDHFVLHYFQEVKKIIPEKYHSLGEERSMYYRLMMSKEVKEKEIGALLYKLYGLRNESEHRFFTDIKTGMKTILRPNTNQVRREVMKIFPVVLRRWLGVLVID